MASAGQRAALAGWRVASAGRASVVRWARVVQALAAREREGTSSGQAARALVVVWAPAARALAAKALVAEALVA